MFRYFEDNYSWHTHFHMALLRGGNISEIDDHCRGLRDLQRERSAETDEAWFTSWCAAADHVAELAEQDVAAGHLRSAGRKLGRASVYYFTAEKMLTNADPRKSEAYDKAIDTLQRSVRYRGDRVEWVEVPYGSASLPAIYVPADSPGPSPCVIHFNGYDGTKEVVYQRIGHEFAQRGLALLIVDQPGTGEAIRKRSLPLEPEAERPAAACIDYVAARDDVDGDRTGLVGVSFGSYHVTRAAAFEPRVRFCVAWGGFWSPRDDLLGKATDRSVESVPPFHRMWVTGTSTSEAAGEVLARCTLEGVADKVTCPILAVYGESDQLVDREQAERQITSAVNSSRAELKVFTTAIGGSEHCQNDNNSLGLDYIADWVSDVLASPAS